MIKMTPDVVYGLKQDLPIYVNKYVFNKINIFLADKLNVFTCYSWEIPDAQIKLYLIRISYQVLLVQRQQQVSPSHQTARQSPSQEWPLEDRM